MDFNCRETQVSEEPGAGHDGCSAVLHKELQGVLVIPLRRRHRRLKLPLGGFAETSWSPQVHQV